MCISRMALCGIRGTYLYDRGCMIFGSSTYLISPRRLIGRRNGKPCAPFYFRKCVMLHLPNILRERNRAPGENTKTMVVFFLEKKDHPREFIFNSKTASKQKIYRHFAPHCIYLSLNRKPKINRKKISTLRAVLYFFHFQ